jgi:CheY-like chemotaxis protein
LVELHRGTIRAQSVGRGKGATFTIELPLIQAEQMIDPPGSTSAETAASSVAPKAGIPRPRELQPSAVPRRVLLVEDHAPTRATMKLLLQRRSCDVATAATLNEARACASSAAFDVVISDIGLPDGSGYELMEHLRECYGLRGIALSGYGMECDVSRSAAAGFVEHLIKPVRVQALEEALARVFDSDGVAAARE